MPGPRFARNLPDRCFGTKRLEQLDVRVANSQHANLDALLRDLFRRLNFQPKRIPPNCQPFLELLVAMPM